MASGATRRIALLSIRPRFAQSILRGEKRVEFRKTRFRTDVSHIVMYASSPVQKIVGYFEVLHIDEDSPDQLWCRYHTVGGISQKDFQAYYGSSARGVAIGIRRVWTLPNPVPLTVLGKSLSPPQSFVYLVDGAVRTLAGLPTPSCSQMVAQGLQLSGIGG